MRTTFQDLKQGYRGVLLAVVIALCAGFLSDHYGAPVMLFALLIGMAFNFLADNPATRKGIDFSSKTLLRVGVALLGFRLSVADVASQGWLSVAVIVGLVAATILSGLVLAPLLKRSTALGILTGGAVGICGASAALAIAAAMPKREGLDQDTLFTVVAVTTLSTIAMVAYPILFTMLGFDDRQAGFLIGATIHDVAQVVGAGYSISDPAGDMATLTKLKRVLLLPVVIVILTLALRAPDAKGAGIPPFVIAFIVFMGINSLGVLSDTLVESLVEASRWFLIIAIAALGVKTSLGAMVGLGGRHILLVVVQTILLLVSAVGVVALV
ncbi:MAG: putative sulfate exporter family transporter [Pseudomonadota bacterium]